MRIKYSGEEEAYYICGVMADRPFSEINFNDITAESKGFILKIPESGALTYNAIVFSPENVNNEALLCLIADMEIIHNETKIAFTGMNTIDDFSGHHQPMVGMIDMDLSLDWAKVYEFQSGIFSGVDLVYNDDDTTLFVLQNSQETDFSIMEIDTTGVIVQGPEAWKFTDTSTERDTTRAHTMHYFNDTLLITGNHFADRITGPSTYVATQYLFSVNVKADTLDKLFDDLTHYSYQDIPVGYQKPIYSFWTPKNSAYLGNDTIYMAGTYNESGNYGFKYVNTGGIHSSCVDILDEEANEVRLYDTTFVEGTSETCDATSVTFDHQDATVSYSWECLRGGDSFLAVDEPVSKNELWRIIGISENGIEALLVSDKATNYHVSVYDILGREVYSSEFTVGKGETSINMNFEVKPEVYIINVSDGKESKSRKVINLNY